MAINVALNLGAGRVILVGFDMKLRAGQANWHQNLRNAPNPRVYGRMVDNLETCAKQLHRRYPDQVVLNATPDSALTCFPAVQLKDVV